MARFQVSLLVLAQWACSTRDRQMVFERNPFIVEACLSLARQQALVTSGQDA